jgi:predicted nucleic acid-binding Zn ribbon protein
VADLPDETGPAGEPRVPDEPEEHRPDGLDLARSQMLGTAGASTTPARRLPRVGSDAAKRKAFRRRGGGRGEPQLSGAYPDGRDPQALTSELGRLISDRGWALDLRVRGVFARWAEIVGPEIGAHSTPESLTDGTLVVRTDSTAWATQLKLLAASVVKRLNEELGDGTVTLVEVLGPHAPSWKHGRRKAPGSRGPRDTYG